jgi:ATP-dependent helicase/nuclease subunit A
MAKGEMPDRLTDRAEREEILRERARNVAIEASAGTGKTHLLTERLVGFLSDGGSIERMAVVTFTRAAAAELRTRVRRKISGGALSGAKAAEQSMLMPAAMIDTIHGFASSVLRRFSHLAGVDPGFTVTSSAFDRRSLARRWDEYLAALDPATVTRNLALLCDAKVDLSELAGALAGLPDWFTGGECIASGIAAERMSEDWWRGRLAALEQEAMACTGPDRLSDWLGHALPLLRRSLEGSFDLQSSIAAFRGYSRGSGNRDSWPLGAKQRIHELATEMKEGMASSLLTGQLLDLAMPFVSALRREKAGARSELTYDDLLWRCMEAFSSSSELRAAVCGELDHLFIDEFQDTSAVQAGLFRELLEGTGERIPQGALTIVGDQKQSIYGWRNADLRSYKAMGAMLEENGALVRPISVNFRSTGAILDFVNAIGPRIFLPQTADLPPDECSYSPLHPRPGAPEGGRVRVMFSPSTGSSGRRRAAEAAWLADFLRRRREEGEGDGWAVIMHTRTGLEVFLERMTAAGIPFVVSAGRDFVKRLEIVDIASLLTCLACPTDRKALLSVLRSTIFGVSDVDITEALAEGLCDFISVPDEVPAEIGRACAVLRRLRDLSLSSTPSVFMEQLLCCTPVAAAVTASGHDTARRLANLQYLFDWAAGSGQVSLAGLHEILTGQGQQAELAEPLSAAGDPSVVTVTTIHQSKGLQYRNVILLASQGGRGREEAVLPSEREGIVGIRSGSLKTPAWNGIAEAGRARTAAEHRRLLYVALTRAEERLIVLTSRHAHAGPMARLFNAGLDLVLEDDPGSVEVGLVEEAPAARPALQPHAPDVEPVEEPVGFEPMTVSYGGSSSPALALGSAVHSILEKIDFRDPQGWLARFLPSMSLPEGVDPVGAAELSASLFDIADLPLVLRDSRLIGREVPIVFCRDGRPQEEYVDLLVEHGGRVFAIDYKTDSVDEEGIASAVQAHAGKQASYGTHLADALGRPVSVWLAFLRPGRACRVADVEPGSAGATRRRS